MALLMTIKAINVNGCFIYNDIANSRKIEEILIQYPKTIISILVRTVLNCFLAFWKRESVGLGSKNWTFKVFTTALILPNFIK